MVTIRPNRTSAGVQTFSLPNIHGDIFATVNADGGVLGTSMTGPFGEALPNKPQVNGQTTSTPWNTLNGASFQYVGQHEKLNEVSLAIQPIQMGARVYIPGLSRFLSVDPVQGGTPNNYVYATDGVNEFDLSGEIAYKKDAKQAYRAWCGNGWWQASCFIPGGLVVKVGVKGVKAVNAVRAVHAAKAAKAAQVAKNAKQGKAAEQYVRNQLVKKYGEKAVSDKPYYSTPLGRRFPDFQVKPQIGRTFNVEVKSGGAKYGGTQLKKDGIILNETGIPTVLLRIP